MNGVCWINLYQSKHEFQPSAKLTAKETEQNRRQIPFDQAFTEMLYFHFKKKIKYLL